MPNEDQTPTTLEGKACEILHWFGSGEVVGIGEIDSSNPINTIDGIPLGPNCWKIWVMHVHMDEVPLYKASRQFFYLEEAKGKSIAWPNDCIRLRAS